MRRALSLAAVLAARRSRALSLSRGPVTIRVADEARMEQLGAAFGAHAAPGKTICLSGDLGAAKGTPLFWGHGVHDDKVLFPHQKIGVDLLTQRGVAVDASQYAMGHGAHPDEMAKLAKFVGDVLFPES